MLTKSLDLLVRHLGSLPDDLGAWLDLAHFLARTGARAPGLAPPVLPRLTAAWARVPEDRTLVHLVLPLLGVGLPGPHLPEPPPWWRASGRVRTAADHHYDGLTGLPLALVDPVLGIEYLLVPPGLAVLGDDPAEARAGLPGFYVARHPVTAAQYQRFLASTSHPAPTDYLEQHAFAIQLARPARPVVFASFHDAAACAGWAGARLPTGDEWERAARGPDARPFPWGGSLPDERRANFNHGVPWRGGDWDRWLAEVGRFPGGASPFGVEDLAGNVREWTTDMAPAPDGEPRLTGTGPREPKRILRGGSWAVVELAELHVAYRAHGLEAGGKADDAGFRLVKDLGTG